MLFSCNKNELSGEEKADPDGEVIRTLSDVNVKADALKAEILNSDSKTGVAAGTIYYISNGGNDLNNGKSSKTAWATLLKVSHADLKSGDMVLFERGGTWRGSLTTKEGITYSAYGKGDKPKIIGSPQNYSIRNKWKATGTSNVYVYDQVFSNDAGVLVFNQGESYTYKKVVGIDGFSGDIGQLTNDLEMYHSISDKKIYLHSYKGNPADRFSSIEFCLKENIIKIGGDNVTIDNICVKYGGVHGIGSSSRNGLKVTNCEFGWIGGSIQRETTRYGNAVEIYGACKDYIVDHCYIYQIYDAGITHQYKNYTSSETVIMENVTYSNNLIEYCSYSIEYFLDQPLSEKDVMKNISFKNNICRFAGYGFGWQRPNKVARHIQGGWLGGKRKYPAENFSIEGNIFDRSIDILLSISALKEEHLPKMKNNVYIQSSNKNFGMVGVEYKQYYPFNQGIGELIKQKRIDESPIIIFAD
ncbi:MAG TPA: hypothetical protein DCY97_19300 [Marinilabiliales bacterium]|nr:hypothetical protein [Marinilabiliales bacterium]